MPSRRSLQDQRYYAHPRNAFWPIMRELLDLHDLDYASLAQAAATAGYAIWDVVQSCHRPGSLDSAIDPGSIVVNDIAGLLAGYPGIRRIYFNGSAAERLFRRLALPRLPPRVAHLSFARLPSTSPAHASLSFERKLAAWRAILRPADSG